MYTVGDFYNAIDSFAPFATTEQWDNTGILIGNGRFGVNRALLALDITNNVLDEAVNIGATLIITHHPVIFQPVERLDSESIVYKLAASGIAVISAHSNLDKAEGGVNDALAGTLGLKNIRPFKVKDSRPCYKIAVFVPVANTEQVYNAMAQAGAGALGNYAHCGFLSNGEGRFLPLDHANPAIGAVGVPQSVQEARIEMLCTPEKLDGVVSAMKDAHPYEQPAYDIIKNHAVYSSLSLGRIGETEKTLTARELAGFVKERLSAPGVRYIDGSRMIETVAVCGGSGADLIMETKRMGAQALVTAEAKHNLLLLAADYGMTLIDAGHFYTENPVISMLAKKLSALLPDAEIIESTTCTDSVHYI